MSAVAIAAYGLVGLVAIPGLTLIVEVLAGLRGLSDGRARPHPNTIAVLVPAHDEASGIAATLAHLQIILPAHSRIVVVADNCTDDTAAIAAGQLGVEVVERNDRERIGKGFALAFGREYLTHAPADLVLVIDADCRMSPDSAESLAERCLATGRPAQAVNLLVPDHAAPASVQISNFAFLVKNLVRARGLQRLSGAVNLTGTGMMFPWPVFMQASLASSALAEDLDIGLKLMRLGLGASLVEQARVESAAAAVGDMLAQRRRWEGGYLAIAARRALPMFFSGIWTWSPRLVMHSFDLMVPPLALLGATLGLTVMIQIVLTAVTGNFWPLALTLGLFAMVAGALVAAWVREGKVMLSRRAIATIPVYMWNKVPLYFSLMRRENRIWRRTQR